MEYINLSNIKITQNNIKFEFLYKSNTTTNNIYFKDQNNNKYKCDILQCNNKIKYDYYNEECYIARVELILHSEQLGQYTIVTNNGKEEIELEIRNNKNEIITEESNSYIIFLKKQKIEIKRNTVIISEIRKLEKVKYEFNKQIYGIKKYNKIFPFRILKRKERKYYLFNDRLLYGDDNAEQLFKYINKTNKKFAKKCYFVLDKDSKEYSRIKKIGKVVRYGSFKHKYLFLNSRMVISSHSSYIDNCFNPFSKEEMDIYKDCINKQFVFVQHGVIMNDVRQYHNRELITADLFITTTKDEYNYMIQPDLSYEEGMVVCTGLPRFDRLKDESDKQNIILISPTWRVLNPNDKFEESEYYNRIQSLLSNDKLNKLINENNYKIKFVLHPVFAKYKEKFMKLKNDNIQILETSQIKYYKLFNECKLLITDYSSIHFDVAFLEKPIIYYQFDKDYFMKHHYHKGYFDYDNDGFGKVTKTENDTIDEIEYYIKNNCKIRNEYKSKIEKTFQYLDHNNSKRVFDKILELDNKQERNYRFNNVH